MRDPLEDVGEISTRVRTGLFPGERVVEFEDADGSVNAVLVPAGQVDEIRQTVQVAVLDEDDEHALVRVPAFGAGDGVITARISKKLLTRSTSA